MLGICHTRGLQGGRGGGVMCARCTALHRAAPRRLSALSHRAAKGRVLSPQPPPRSQPRPQPSGCVLFCFLFSLSLVFPSFLFCLFGLSICLSYLCCLLCVVLSFVFCLLSFCHCVFLRRRALYIIISCVPLLLFVFFVLGLFLFVFVFLKTSRFLSGGRDHEARKQASQPASEPGGQAVLVALIGVFCIFKRTETLVIFRPPPHGSSWLSVIARSSLRWNQGAVIYAPLDMAG